MLAIRLAKRFAALTAPATCIEGAPSKLKALSSRAVPPVEATAAASVRSI
jgi:hypothetical protein